MKNLIENILKVIITIIVLAITIVIFAVIAIALMNNGMEFGQAMCWSGIGLSSIATLMG